MKKKMLFIVPVLFLVGVLLIVANQGCKGKVSSSVKNSFSEVTSQLDEGGSVYLYVSTERMIKALDDMVLKIKNLAALESSTNPEEGKENAKVIDFFYGLFKKSGLMEISGIGFSSVTMEESLNHSKLVIHHYKDSGKGIIWQFSESKPHKLEMLNLLPTTTAFAGYGDFKFGNFWDWVKQEINTSDIPAAKQGMAMAESSIQMLGIDLNKLKTNMSNGMGVVLTLDKGKMCKIPAGSSIIEVPDPGLAIVVYVKDDYIFNLLKSKISIAKPTVDKNMKKLSIPVPVQGLPITLDPVIVQKGNMLVLASSGKLVDAMFSAQDKGNGLTTTEEFKKFSKAIPEEGNSFRYLGTELFNVIMGLVKKSMAGSEGGGPQSEEASKLFSDMIPQNVGLYGVVQNTPEGFVFTFNHTFNLEQVVLLPVTIIPAMVAAIALPNFLTAMQKGKEKATMGDLKSIGIAIESYMTDNYEAPTGNTIIDIQPKLVPFYIKMLPLKDAWGNDFLYKHGTGKNKDIYFIASPGKDGIFNGWDQTGFYTISSPNDYNNDIIYSNGVFVYGPEIH